jgi:hypothetical protein
MSGRISDSDSVESTTFVPTPTMDLAAVGVLIVSHFGIYTYK